MSYLLNDVKQAQIIYDLIVATSFSHNTIVLLIHCYFTLQSYKIKKSTRLRNISLFALSLTFFSSLWILLLAFNLIPVSCKWIIIIAMMLYMSTKIILYFLFLERLFSIFSDTTYGFNKKNITISRVIFAIYLLSMWTVAIFVGDGDYSSIRGQCASFWPYWLNLSFAVIDIIWCTTISILFSRRLLSLHLETMTTSNNDNTKIKRVLKRSTLLTTIALFTTSLSLVIAGILGLSGMWISSDSMVNCWCIMLMFRFYDKIYIICCNRMEFCVSINCLKYYSCNCFCTIYLSDVMETKHNDSPSTMNPTMVSMDTTRSSNPEKEVSP